MKEYQDRDIKMFVDQIAAYFNLYNVKSTDSLEDLEITEDKFYDFLRDACEATEDDIMNFEGDFNGELTVVDMFNKVLQYQ